MRNSIIIALVLAAACGDKPEAQQGPAPDTAGGRPDLSTPQVGAQVAVMITDTEITTNPDSIQMVGTGQTTFSMQNKGTSSGEVAIEGGPLGRWSSTPIPPGQAILMSQLMGRGEYEIVWPGGGKELRKKIKVY